MSKKKVILAYSGGLDTSYCIVYLNELGYEVHAVLVNTGGFTADEIQELERRAFTLGAKSFKEVNNENEYYDKCLRYLIYGNILRNNTYPLSVSSERTFQAKSILEEADVLGIDAVAHGSTGAGNDQIRFDTVFRSRNAKIQIITPIRDQSLSREEEISYLLSRDINWIDEKKAYSINQGLWGTSVGGKETLTSRFMIPEDAWPAGCQKSESSIIKLTFKNGEPISIDDQVFDSSVSLIKQLNDIGNQYAIGRDVHVGDTIIGIKGRVAFAAPAAMLIIKSHELLEKHTLSKWQQYWKSQLGDWYGMFLHEGKYYDPVMRDIESFLTNTQDKVNGSVYIKLKPYHFELQGIESGNDLMSSDFGQYGESNKAWTGEDVKGFTQIYSNAEKIYYHVNDQK